MTYKQNPAYQLMAAAYAGTAVISYVGGHMTAKAPSKVVFVAKRNDPLAIQLVMAIQKKGHTVHVLEEKEEAPIASVVFYTSYGLQKPRSLLRTAAHHLMDDRPDWARTTPFVVAIRDNAGDPPNKKKVSATEAAIQVAEQYVRWFAGVSGLPLPWAAANERVATTYTQELQTWLEMASRVIGRERLNFLIQGNRIPESQQGRGGEVIFNQLFNTGRIVLAPSDVPTNLRGNTVFRRFSGFKGPVVNYGTSDLANVFELLQTLKLAKFLDLPAVFDTYPGAHNLRYWLDGFLNPSLKLLGTSLKPEDFGLTQESKYTSTVDEKTIANVVQQAELDLIRNEAQVQSPETLSAWYNKALQLVGQEFQKLLGMTIQYSLASAESLIGSTKWWNMSARSYAAELEKETGHPVIALRDPQGKDVMTSTVTTWRPAFNSAWKADFSKSLAQLHSLGWWLGGAGLYRAAFSLGEHGGVVFMVKDGAAGQVNLLARPYLSGASGLYLSPVGLFRLTAEGQNEDWSIDPWVLLHLLRKWGPRKAREEARKIWDAMEVPLAIQHVGRKTVATVTREGVHVTVTDPE